MSYQQISSTLSKTNFGGWTVTDITTVGSGNYTVPSGVDRINLILIGGGGGGASGAVRQSSTTADVVGGAGGSGGGCAIYTDIDLRFFTKYSLTIPYSVGAGGAGGALPAGTNTASSYSAVAGSAGGSTSFGNLSVSGGNGGPSVVFDAASNPGAAAITVSAATLTNASLMQTSGYDTLAEFADLVNSMTVVSSVPAYLRAFTSGAGGSGSQWVSASATTPATAGGIPALFSAYSFSTIFSAGSNGTAGANVTSNGNSGIGGVASLPGICGGGGGGGGKDNSGNPNAAAGGAPGYFGGGGGGGAGRNTTVGMTGGNGAANTGGGGGGGGGNYWTSTSNTVTSTNNGGTGGSGRIIVFYRT